MERSNSGCSWPCDTAKESVFPNTHLRLWLNDDDDDDVTRSRVFFRASRQVRLIISNLDWLIVLSVSVVIG